MPYKKITGILMILCICAIGFMHTAAFAADAEFIENFDAYLREQGGTPPSGWSVNASDTNAKYNIYSVATERGRSAAITVDSSTTQVQFNRNYTVSADGTYAFEISVLRQDLASEYTVSIRQGNTGAYGIVLKTNGTITALGDNVPSFTYKAGQWLDLKLVIMPGISKYTFIARQGESYVARTAMLNNVFSIKDFRFYFKAGTYPGGSTILFDDVKIYSCDDIVIPKSDTDDVAFALSATEPLNGQKHIGTDEKVRLWFNEAVINDSAEGLFTLNGEAVEADRVTFSADLKCITADLNGLLALGSEYVLAYSNVVNSGGEELSGEMSFTTADEEYFLADTQPKSDNSEYTVTLGGKSNKGEAVNLKACFAFYDTQTGVLKKLQAEDIVLESAWSEQKIEVTAHDEADLGEVYFVDNLYDVNIKGNKEILFGEAIHAEAYSGDKELEYSVDYENSKLTLSGSGAEENVTITVLKPGHTADELSGDNLSAADAVSYVVEAPCADGSFSFSYVLSGESGEMTVLVNRHDGNGVKEYSGFVFYMTQTAISEAIEKYNEDDADYAQLILETARAFNLDMTLYSDLSDDAKAAVYAALKNEKPYTTPEEIYTVFDRNTILQSLNEAADKDAFNSILWSKIQALSLDEAQLYPTYLEYTDRIREAVSSRIFGTKISSLDALTEKFNEKIILCAVEAGELYTEIKSILETNFDYLDWDLSDYKKLRQVKNVYAALLGKSYSSLEELYDDFRAAVKKQKSSENKTSAGGGGGGGGKSKGSTAVVIQKEPTVKEEVPSVVIPVPEEIKTVFADLENFPWAQEAVNALAAKNILNGKETGKFYPADILKREELVKCLVCAFEAKLPKTDEQIVFEDTDADAWYMPYVEKAYAGGIIKGISEKLFGTGEVISRQDLAVMCVRAAKMCGIEFASKASSFTDASEIAPYALEAVNMLYGEGIMIGDENGAFRPGDGASRAEAAKILYIILQKGEML